MYEKIALPLHAAPGEMPFARGKSYNLTLDNIESDPLSKIVAKHFDKKSKWDKKVVESIVNDELKPNNFAPQKIMLLEYKQCLEKYLWPHFDDKATVNHVLLVCLIINEKARQHIPVWEILGAEPERFSSLFDRVIHLCLSSVSKDVPLALKRHFILFLVHCFQNLGHAIVRPECLKLFSIGIWTNLEYEQRRDLIFAEHVQLRKLWNSNQKKFNNADKATQKKLEFERTWLHHFLIEFVETLFQISEEGEVDEDVVLYCERALELLIDIESQLSTRRFFNTLLDDNHIVLLCKMAPFMKRTDTVVGLLKQQLAMLEAMQYFEINDQTGQPLTDVDATEARCEELVQLQRTVFKHFRDTFPQLPLTNLGAIEQPEDLLWHLKPVGISELERLCSVLGIRTSPLSRHISLAIDQKELILAALVAKFEKRARQVDKIKAMPLYPDEDILFSETLIQNQFYAGGRPLPLPKLNLQFLTTQDYLLRNFALFRLESFYEIRQDMEDVVKRLSPRLSYPERKTEFAGWARMATPLDSFTMIDVVVPNLRDQPTAVLAEVKFNVGRFTEAIRNEWDNLHKHDVLFLVTIFATDQTANKYIEGEDFRKHYGIKFIRGCEVSEVLDKNGRSVPDFASATAHEKTVRWNGTRRTLRVALDPIQYENDRKAMDGRNYDTFNVLVRRKPQENNFKAVLETIRDLMESNVALPDWLQKVFLGYGDPAGAHYTKLDENTDPIDFRDTFLDLDHVKESFPGKTVRAASDQLEPPYIIQPTLEEHVEEPAKKAKKTKKTKKSEPEETSTEATMQEVLEVSSYDLPNMGPYPQNLPKKNTIRFTSTQAEAIHSGMHQGLTMVVGPPGTGKTDVAAQIVSNLYHANPNHHTLIVTHSNQALNHLFEKMTQRDIDPRHMLRLGHGEEELTTGQRFSKQGRVEAYLERRLELLSQVERLATTLSLPAEHGASCETADYFFHYHVQALWETFETDTEKSKSSKAIREHFPFQTFFSDAPSPLFSDDMSRDEASAVAQGCYRYLKNIFTQLEEVRPFELLRSSADRANYLLTKEAKIVAMTSTHAALKRRELMDLGFTYSHVIIEEAAQMLDIETFIPLLLQGSDHGDNPLESVVLIGDHYQLPPVVKNVAFQQYGHLEQSLFTRLVRLGVPTLQLDAQGRARSTLADLFRWRYDGLGDLPLIKKEAAFHSANPGLTYDYQFVHVDAYQGEGESEPVPYFYQNLGEAEYIVALYQYMRLSGYPADKITILTTYNGQKSLINDVIERRCGWTSFFGRPVVSTVDQWQGQQNDYVLLSLVRTKSVGHLRDVRRLIVAVSRARLGLYVFGNKDLFANCVELKPVFDQLLARPVQLSLHKNEQYPSTKRKVNDARGQAVMQDIEAIGKLVYNLSDKLELEEQNDDGQEDMQE